MGRRPEEGRPRLSTISVRATEDFKTKVKKAATADGDASAYLRRLAAEDMQKRGLS